MSTAAPETIVAKGNLFELVRVSRPNGLIFADRALSTLGATVERTPKVFELANHSVRAEGQALEEGEQVEPGQWFSYQKAWQMILDGKLQEDRVAMILARWLAKQMTVTVEAV